MLKTLFSVLAIAAMTLLPALAETASAQAVTKQGTFRNAGGHETSGSVKLERSGNTWKVVMGANFKHDGAPDPKVAFGNGKYVKGTIISRLKKNNGAQSYTVPASLDVSKFTQVWIWCEKYNVPLGVASIK